MTKKIAVILSGCGVFDGSEIQEVVLSLLAITENGATYQCFAPDIEQYHVLNHITGEEIFEKRNVLIEAARIDRGNTLALSLYKAENFDGLLIPGGFGAAKNLTKWAFNGSDGEINNDVQTAILSSLIAKIPIVGLCMGPTVIARALKGTGMSVNLTVGTTTESSNYDIAEINEGLVKTGAVAEMKTIREISIDVENKIITAPCYMMEADILQIRNNIKQAIDAMFKL